MEQNYLWNVLAASMTKTDWAGVPNLTGEKSGEMTSEFQKLLEQKNQPAKTETPSKEQPKTEKPAVKKDDPVQNEEEDPIETSKRLQVYLAPVSPEELAQYPAEWLPQVQEGEPIFNLGVRTGENGEAIPILVGAEDAAKFFGQKVIAPWGGMDASAPETDAVLETADPGVDNDPSALLEKNTAEQFGREIEQTVEEVQPQESTEDDSQVEITDAEQAPQQLFRDVEAAPIKVGEAPAAAQSEQPQDVSEQIAGPLDQALAQGETRVEIKLTPDSLGSVTIEITHSQDGGLHVALSAESDQTRSLLEKHAANLQGLLANRGQESVQVEVQHNQESQRQNDQYDGQNGHNGHPQQQERRRQQEQHGQDFLHQLRLGLVPVDEEAF